MHSRVATIAALALLTFALGSQAQRPPAGGPGNGGPGGQQGGPGDNGGGPGGGGPNGGGFKPTQTDTYKSEIVKLGGDAADALLFTPVKQSGNPHVAIVTTYQPPVSELADRGYQGLLVRHMNKRGAVPTPFDGFDEISRGIAYMRTQPGIQKVVVAAWGGGATTMILYADVAERGPKTCQAKEIIAPCTTEQASNLSKPDGVVLFDPSLGGAWRMINIDAAYDGTARTRTDLDLMSPANGYDLATGTAHYSADFRKKYNAAQTVRNNQIVDQAIERAKQLQPGQDEPYVVPGGVNPADIGSLHHPDLSVLAHTKKPHILLKADGSKPEVVIPSIRPDIGPIGEDAVQKAIAQNEHPRQPETLRQFLANDAVRTTKDFAVTVDDVTGIDWKTSNAASPAQAEGITVPTLIETNTCFQFVVPSEIVFDHIAAKDKTYFGVEGSLHFFNACKPEYGDTKKRLFDFVDSWLAKPKRF